MHLTRKELEAVGQAIGFVMAGELEEWDDTKTIAALNRAWEKITRALQDAERSAQQRSTRRGLRPPSR